MQPQLNPPPLTQLLKTLVLAITEARDQRSALSALIAQICLNAGWDYGEAWTVETGEDGDQDHLFYVADWHTGTLSFESFAGHSRTLTLGRDDVLAGQAWTSCAPVWLKTMDTPGFRRGQVASRVGLTKALAIPLLLDNEPNAILTFFMSIARDTDEAVVNTLWDNSQLLGALVSRKSDDVEIAIDQAEFERATESLRMSQALLSSILDSALDAVISIDESQRITLYNRAAERMFGCPAEEAIGQTLDRFIPYRFRDIHFIHVADFGATDLTQQAVPVHTPIMGLRANGTEFPLESSISHTTVGGTKVFTAILRDITERNRMEEARRAQETAEQANKAKSEFLSRMSHELRTPLNSIIGFADLLNMEGLGARQLENLGYIRRAGKHLLQLVNEVLDITRIEAGTIGFSLEPVDLAELMREVVDVVRPLAEARAISLNVNQAQAETYVQADRQRLKQVLLNLVSNAIKYNVERGSITIRVSPGTEGTIRIGIADTGIGIDPQKMNKLFMPFERLGAERLDTEGTGLGLALSKRLVEAMSGTIGVESAPGKGSLFWVEMPRAMAPNLTTRNLANTRFNAPELPGYTATVLYVEDNLSNLRLVERILEHRRGIKLLSCMQGRLALDIAREQRPDLILLDLHLPDITGHEVLQTLKSDPQTEDIPIVIVSADTTKGSIERLTDAGAFSYLTKPIEVRRFLRVLDDALASSN